LDADTQRARMRPIRIGLIAVPKAPLGFLQTVGRPSSLAIGKYLCYCVLTPAHIAPDKSGSSTGDLRVSPRGRKISK
jgi:hypothetical protein